MALVTTAPAPAAPPPPPPLTTETTGTTEIMEKEKKKTNLTTTKQQNPARRLVEYFVVVASKVQPRDDGDDDNDDNDNNTNNNKNKNQRQRQRQRKQKQKPSDIAISESFDDDDGDEYDNDIDDDEIQLYLHDYNFQPKITARYPIIDHPENPLHENVTCFCHPSGNIVMRTDQTLPKIHFFAATGGTGKLMYGTCLTIWEPHKMPSQNNDGSKKNNKMIRVFLPKCLVILSSYQYLTAFREYLTQLNRLSKNGDMTLPVERYIVNFCAEIPAPAPGAFEVQTTILDSIIKIWAPPHNQPIAWVALPFPQLFECLDVGNIVQVWHCLALERQVLITSTQLSLLTTCAEILLSLLYPMQWSHAYIPVLPHFLVPMLSAPMPFFCGINKSNLASALCDLSGDCVVVDLDMNLVTLGPNTPPLPQMPPQMEGILRARLDENVGMVFREARSLNKNDDYSERGLYLPPHVKVMADAMWEGKLCLFDEAFQLAFTPEESKKDLLNGNDGSGLDSSEAHKLMMPHERNSLRDQSKWDAVQEAYMDNFVYLLRNYRKFLVFPSKDNEGSYGGAGFRSKEFVEQQRYDMQEFLSEFIGTQMFDNFVTKRLYGSGEADVAFFDIAVDRFLKNAGLLSNVDLSGRLLRGSMRRQQVAPKLIKPPPNKEPLLQSARVHRKLKTIVPPEPSGDGLPPIPSQKEQQANENMFEGGAVLTEYVENDDSSVGSMSTSGTRESKSTSTSTVTTPRRSRKKKTLQDKAAEILEKSKYRYSYPIFPTSFRTELFGEPRPLSQAVIAEFDRQKKDAARFRRKGQSLKSQTSNNGSAQIRRAENAIDDTPPNPEVATFTLFFMAFSAVVGKELMDISENPLLAQDKTILATYTHGEEDSVSKASMPDTIETEVEEETESEVDAVEKAAVADMKSTRPDLGGLLGEDDDEDDNEEAAPLEEPVKSEEEEEAKDEKPSEVEGETEYFADDVSEMTPVKEEVKEEPEAEPEKEIPTDQEKQEPRSRFTTSLSKAQIEEAQTTGRAQLALAFEMLGMMKKRGLKADPEAYQCLIDACGRVGDTKRATQLLSRMHEDGIVADGVVYSCLVSAFSAESAWKQVSGDKPEEDLPEWANSTSIEMDWNKLQQKSFLDRAKKELRVLAGGALPENEIDGEESTLQRLARNYMGRTARKPAQQEKKIEAIEFYVSQPVEMQIELGENLLEIVYSDISVDTDNETCPRCNFLLSDDDVVNGWTPSDSQDYTTSCPNCTQRFVPHFCVQSTASQFMGSRGPESPLMCERLSPWVLQKEIRTVMADREGIENILSPEWREKQTKNAVLWWNIVLSCMRYRFPFSFLLQGSFEQNLIAPMPEQDE